MYELANTANGLYDSISSVIVYNGKTPEDPKIWEFRFNDRNEKISIDTDHLENYSNFQKAHLKTYSFPAPNLRKGTWINLLMNISKNKMVNPETSMKHINEWNPNRETVHVLLNDIEVLESIGLDIDENLEFEDDRKYADGYYEGEFTLGPLDFKHWDILIACDSNGDCLLRYDIDEMGAIDETGYTIKNIDEIEAILDEAAYIEHMTTEDD